MGNFVRVLSNFAPSPILPAGKLYTTPTVLSSGEALKKMNFVGILLNSRVSSLPRQERSLIALSMQGAKHQRGHRLTVDPEGGS